MGRRHMIIASGALSALLVLYCVSFGPIVFLWGKAAHHDLVPTWLDDGLSVVFHPHLRCMYHSETYFSYIFWFVVQGAGPITFTWNDFRDSLDNPDG
ncbi:MAG: hypothetical protein H0W78_01635 [Planctomycetes bacterium]|nr:hypothetical protein [Planctomycetota bacterium]